MKNTTVIRSFKILPVIGLIVALTGCANMMKSMGYEPVDSPAVKACKQSNVLITNLAAKPNKRQYMLPNGQLCPSGEVSINEYKSTKKA